jgi:DNA (cytosine-5)-methyltransferase 1
LEICAGGGGQALGLEMAGFECAAAVEIDRHACETLRLNRPDWTVIEEDVHKLDGRPFQGVDLFAGGVPCPPFSIAGKQLGHDDERDLFPEALRLIGEVKPRAVLLENVPGFASLKFESYRRGLWKKLSQLGYHADFQILNAKDFGVPQLRPRFVLVAMKPNYFSKFAWPGKADRAFFVGEVLEDLMGERGWPGVKRWKRKAMGVAPTLVGGSHKHGGPDLGPTRARQDWALLGINGLGLADEAPGPDFPVDGMPKLSLRMAARIQGFPDAWSFAGKKTAQYRQIGNAFPPPVARAVAGAILDALNGVPTKRSLAAGLFAVAEP